MQNVSHNDYELRVIEYMAKMTGYLESKDVPEMKMASNPTVSSHSLRSELSY